MIISNFMWYMLSGVRKEATGVEPAPVGLLRLV